ncbi:uncharacterized protein K460DRAFT_393764 [Cucurbitaria berberidis CBS 394.84]|uniref:BTB domain-containing protein n=1 Tax=Cucurbitaria berberidis CBS 394.84 TaxID=1168544 RepID=A0A9P4LBN8_9PLEO|nr:uncharacterized protein K460DRAFT_393764 [Cucurbitaria berberidis CBS 394.84]KAF1848768.1 hypothetical protein K460DRAFT_393764 [Cucurbitaria berberidis CBS 394.84]
MSKVREQLLALLSSGKYSDLVITCGSDTHNVHKAIVCTRSGFFERAETFAVGREAAESKIDLPEDEPAIIRLLVQFLYECAYDIHPPVRSLSSSAPQVQPWFPHSCHTRGAQYSLHFPCKKELCEHHICGTHCRSKCSDFTCSVCDDLRPHRSAAEYASRLLVHAKMYEVGDKYQVTGLKELARENFQAACAVSWDDEQFAVAARHVFTSTPESDGGLRGVVMEVLRARRGVLTKPCVGAFLRQHPGVMYELLAGNAGM